MLAAALLGAASIAMLSVHACAQAPVIGQGGAAPSQPLSQQSTHMVTAAPSPAITGCATASVGSDTSGSVTATATATCTITFAASFGTPPACVVSDSARSVTWTLSATVFSVVGVNAGYVVAWFCVGKTGL
jgi:lysozyme family protein